MQWPEHKASSVYLDGRREEMRPPEEVMDPERLGAARPTRHSFARSFIRHAVDNRWRVEHESWRLDAEGRGEAVYLVKTRERDLRFVVLSSVIPEETRTDRVVAESWDVTAALVEGDLDSERLEKMRQEVPQQESGRADSQTLVWTRGNRSSRFFGHVVERLADGQQPDAEFVGEDGYMLRSTAFYANGKFGMKPFSALDPGHPVGASYHAQMLAAWLFREFSYDLAEHCARERSGGAVQLQGYWRRFFGIGNATGLGMVPFFVNHPAIIDAWCAVRELALARATEAEHRPGDPEVERLLYLMERGVCFFEERAGMYTEPFDSCEELARQLAAARRLVAEFSERGTVNGRGTNKPWQELCRWTARDLDVEGQELVNGLLTELYPDLDSELQELMEVGEETDIEPRMNLGELRRVLEERYGWALALEFGGPDSTKYFWYVSANSEEPRRGLRGEEPGEEFEQPYDVARQARSLYEDLSARPDEDSVAAFLLEHPEHRGIVERVQSFRSLPYAEVRTNYVDANFLPLYLQKFKLATYGMENYKPKSTDWLRVTLMQGAPRAKDVEAGEEGEWIFPLKPR